MNGLEWASKKLKAPRLLQPEAPPRDSFKIDRSHPQLRGCVHWWDGIYGADGGADGKTNYLNDILGTLTLPYYYRASGQRPYWNMAERAVTFEDATADWTYFRTASLQGLPGSSALTLSAWFKTTRDFQVSTTKELGVFSWGYPGVGDTFALHIDEDSGNSRVEFKFTVMSGYTETSGHVYVTDTTPYDQEWVHFAGVFSGAQAPKIFLNGFDMALDASATSLATASSASRYWLMGRVYPGTGVNYYSFPGMLRDVRVYDRALTSGEVFGLHKAPYASLNAPQRLVSPIQIIHPDMVFESGNYIVGGPDIGLITSRIMDIAAGSYATTGNSIALTREFLLELSSGSYTITPADIGLTQAALLEMNAGAYNITGGPLTFTFTQAPVPGLFVLSVSPAGNTLSVRDVANTLA